MDSSMDIKITILFIMYNEKYSSKEVQSSRLH
jgi:hypothetical protein